MVCKHCSCPCLKVDLRNGVQKFRCKSCRRYQQEIYSYTAYENDTLKFTNTEEGRVIMTAAQPEYQYHLKDHLGNVRMTFTTKDEVEAVEATLETESMESDAINFLRYDQARRVQSHLFDHTKDNEPVDSIGYAVRLNGSENEKVGLAKSFSVMPGDTIKAKVFAKYVDPDDDNWSSFLQTFMGFFSPGATVPAGTIIDGSGHATSGSTPVGFLLGTPTGEDQYAPKAYLNYIFLDRNYDISSMKFAFDQISGGMEDGSNVEHDSLMISQVVMEPGYVYVYLSNDEEGREVYFDDFKVEHVKSPVIESTDYYPFGLSFNSYSRENSVPNPLQYNSMELQDELSLGWYDYIARQYDPSLGRFLSIDLKADLSRRWSPYAYGYNNPIRFTDPDGMSAEDSTKPKEYDNSHNYITVSYSGGPMSSSTNTVTEVNKTSSGKIETDADGNEMFVERSSTTTTTEVFDADGNSIGQSQNVVTTEKKTTIEPDAISYYSSGSYTTPVKGKEISTVTTFKNTEFNPSESFKSVASMTSDWSRLHPGSSINYAAADYFQKHLSNDGADDRVKAGYAALEAISLIAASSKQLYYDKWNGSTVVDRRSDKLIKSIMNFGKGQR